MDLAQEARASCETKEWSRSFVDPGGRRRRMRQLIPIKRLMGHMFVEPHP